MRTVYPASGRAGQKEALRERAGTVADNGNDSPMLCSRQVPTVLGPAIPAKTGPLLVMAMLLKKILDSVDSDKCRDDRYHEPGGPGASTHCPDLRGILE